MFNFHLKVSFWHSAQIQIYIHCCGNLCASLRASSEMILNSSAALLTSQSLDRVQHANVLTLPEPCREIPITPNINTLPLLMTTKVWHCRTVNTAWWSKLHTHTHTVTPILKTDLSGRYQTQTISPIPDTTAGRHSVHIKLYITSQQGFDWQQCANFTVWYFNFDQIQSFGNWFTCIRKIYLDADFKKDVSTFVLDTHFFILHQHLLNSEMLSSWRICTLAYK